MPQGALDETEVHAGFEQMGGVRMSEGRDGHTCLGDAGSWCGCAEGALDAGPTPGGGRHRTVLLIPPGGGKEPGVVTRGVPGGSQQSQRIFGQGDVTILGALASVDMDLEALAVHSGDLKGAGFMEPETQTRDGGEGDLMVSGGSRREETSDFFHTEDSGETVSGLSAHERQSGPVTLQDVRREASDAAVADAQRSRGEAVDICSVQEVLLKCLFSDAGE